MLYSTEITEGTFRTKRSALRRKGVLPLLLVLMAWCAGCAGNSTSGNTTTGTTASVAAPSPFIVYDDTRYPNSQAVLGNIGALRNAVFFSQTSWPGTCTSTGCSNAPTQAQFQSLLQTYVKEFGSSQAIIFDFEDLVISKESSTAAANNAVALFLQMIAWTRALYPNAKIGIYDYDWNSNYAPGSSTGFNAIRAQLFKGGTASFDFFAPTMYQRWTTHAIWDQNLAQAIINDSAINLANGVKIPIYPYISPFVGGNTANGSLTDSEWTSEMTDLLNCNIPSSSACSAVMSSITPAEGSCSSTGSTTPCTPTSGTVLWTQSTTTNLDPSASWVSDLSLLLSPTVSANVIYQIADAESTPLCLDSNATVVVPSANSCSTRLSQTWKFSSLGTGMYTVSSYLYQNQNANSNASEVLDGTNSPVVIGAPVVFSSLLSSGTPTIGEQWQVVSLGGGYYEFVLLANYTTTGATNSEECLTAGASQQVLTTSVCNLGANQIFRLIPE